MSRNPSREGAASKRRLNSRAALNVHVSGAVRVEAGAVFGGLHFCVFRKKGVKGIEF